MHAQNEVGTLQPIARDCAACRGARRAGPRRRGPVGRQDPGRCRRARRRSADRRRPQALRAQGRRRALRARAAPSCRRSSSAPARGGPPAGHRERRLHRGARRRMPHRRGRPDGRAERLQALRRCAARRACRARCPASCSSAIADERLPNTLNVLFPGVVGRRVLRSLPRRARLDRLGLPCRQRGAVGDPAGARHSARRRARRRAAVARPRHHCGRRADGGHSPRRGMARRFGSSARAAPPLAGAS